MSAVDQPTGDVVFELVLIGLELFLNDQDIIFVAIFVDLNPMIVLISLL